MNYIVVIGLFKACVEEVYICEDKETADNISLDLEEKGHEVQRFDNCEPWNMERYNR